MTSLRHLRPSQIIGLTLALVLTGCYSYEPVPQSIEKEDYTGLQEEEKLNIPSTLDLLTLEKAQEIAVKNNPSFQSIQHAMGAARARYYQSLSAYLPTVSAYYEIGRDNTYPRHYKGPFNDPNKTYEYTNEVGMRGQWLIFDGLMRTMNMLSKRYAAKQRESLVEDARRLLAQSVAETYHSILLAEEQKRIAQADLDFNRKLEKETQIKFEAGAVALTDVLNFKIKATQAENNLIIQTYNLRTAKYALAELMALTDGTIPDRVTFTSVADIDQELLTDINVYLDTALQNRQDLQAYRQALKSSKYYLYTRWGSLFPKFTFNLGGSYERQRTRVRGDNGPHAPYNAHERTRYLNYSLNADWVLFEGGSRFAEIREAQALVAESEYTLEKNWLNVIAEVREAYDECRKSALQLILFKKIQGASQTNRDLVEEEYKAGNTNITRLNQAQRDLITAQSQLASAKINVLDAKVLLKAAIGQY